MSYVSGTLFKGGNNFAIMSLELRLKGGDVFVHGCLILHIHKTYMQKLISCLHALVFF